MRNPFNLFGAWLESFFQHDPKPWIIGPGKAAYPMYFHEKPTGLPEISKGIDLKRLTTKEQRKRLNHVMSVSNRNFKDGKFPGEWLDHTGCVIYSLITLKECWRRGYPARLVSCEIKTTKYSGRTRQEKHMVVECHGWVLDTSLKYDAASNVDYVAEWVAISGFDLVAEWKDLGI